MKRQPTRLLLLAVLTGLLFALFVWPLRNTRLYHQGRFAGRRAVRTKTLALYGFGLPADWSPIYRDLLLKRYGVRVIDHGCVIDAGKERWIEGFDEVVVAHFTASFHRDVLSECASDARRLHQERVTLP